MAQRITLNTIGKQGPAGPTGPAGPAGGSDAATAEHVTTGPLTSAALSATYAPGVSLPAASGGDDLAAINATLASHAGKRVTGKPGSAYQISGPIVIPSNTTLDMTGCTITLTAGKRMVQNEALLGVGARDTDVHVLGGTWDRGAQEAVDPFDLHCIVFHRADRCSVRDLTVLSTGGKYAVYGVDVTDYTAERIHFETASDGVHVTGPARGVTIRDLTGTTGDDFVSFTGRDYVDYEFTTGGGSISDVLVENMNPADCDGNVVKLLPGQGMTMSNVTVNKIAGSTLRNGVTIFDDNAQPATVGGTLVDAVIRDVSVETLDIYEPVHINHSDARSVTIDGLKHATPTSTYLVHVEGTVEHLTVRGIQGASVDTAARVIKTKPAANIGTLTLDRATIRLATTGRLLHIEGTVDRIDVRSLTIPTETSALVLETVAGATVGQITVDSVRAVMKADKSAGRLMYLSSAVTRSVSLRNVDVSGGLDLVDVQATSSVPVVQIANVTATCSTLLYHRAANALEAHMANIDTTAGALATVIGGAGCSLTLRGSQIKGTTWATSRSGSQTLRVVGAELRSNAAEVTATTGDTFYNHSGTSGAGWYQGPVTWDGSKFVPVRGYAATGDATLVAGTVTVADTKVTATSRIRLFVKTPGGTVGSAYVSAITAGSGFTITSTSATDTSVIRWEVVAY